MLFAWERNVPRKAARTASSARGRKSISGAKPGNSQLNCAIINCGLQIADGARIGTISCNTFVCLPRTASLERVSQLDLPADRENTKHRAARDDDSHHFVLDQSGLICYKIGILDKWARRETAGPIRFSERRRNRPDWTAPKDDCARGTCAVSVARHRSHFRANPDHPTR